MLQGGSTGPGIVPGSPNASEIYVRQTDGSVHFGQMLEDELLALQVWIENDAPEK
jgi:predicted NBD/HSP70 family sugar kinase